MGRLKAIFAGAVLGAAMVAVAAAQDGGGKADQKAAPTPFERIKALAGSWHGPDEDGDGAPDYRVTYKVTSAGSAVQETLMPGTPHEMVTMYFMDHDALLMTHYCAAGNQPRMKAEPTKNKDEIDFKFMDGTNMDPDKDLYMGALTVKFIDKDHFEQKWTSFQGGQAQEPHEFKWSRDRASGGEKDAAETDGEPAGKGG